MADFTTLLISRPLLLAPSNPVDYATVVYPLLRDLNPPTIDQVTPAAGSVLTRTTTISFRLRDAEGFALRELWIGFGAAATSYELVHNGTAFLGEYAAGSSLTPTTNGWIVALVRASGWPYGSQVRLRADVVDVGGNIVVISA